MGITYPEYNIPDTAINTILKVVEQVKSQFTPDKQANLTHRPLRPNELATLQTLANRVYHHKASATTFENILRDGTNIVILTVPTGRAIVFFGWIFIDDPALPLGLDGVARIKINGVVKNEVCTKLIDVQDGHMLLTLDQIVIARQQTTVEVQVKGASTADNIIIFPLAYVVGPKNQLDVT